MRIGSSRKFVISQFISLLLLTSLAACNSNSVEGTYQDVAGSVIVELRSGGKSNFTFEGQVLDCTYHVDGKQITMACKGDAGKTVFNIHDDGSLTGPPGSFIPVLRKQK